MMGAIQAVTFDVGGTLIEPWPSVGEIYARVAAELGHGPFEIAQLNRHFAHAWKDKVAFDYSRAAWSNLVDRVFSGLVAPPQLPRLFECLFNRFRDPNVWRIHDDVWPTLGALRERGIRLGLISNWDDRLRPLLANLGLSAWFEVIVVSCDLAVTKPDARLFREAATRFGLPPTAILHVGDSVSEDCEGARAAGLQSVWLNRGGDAKPGQVPTLFQLASRIDATE